MPQTYGRHNRVAELIKRELSTFIVQQFPARRFGLITISTVSLSMDLTQAKVFFTCLGGESSCELIELLNDFVHRCRHHLAKRTALRHIPNLSFHFDNSTERGQHLSTLIDSL